MQVVHKLNGYPYIEFEKIGISQQALYRLKRENNDFTDRRLLNRAFNIKFGNKGIVEERMFKYYVSKAISIKLEKISKRIIYLEQLRDDLYDTCRLFNIETKIADAVWEEVNKYYLI